MRLNRSSGCLIAFVAATAVAPAHGQSFVDVTADVGLADVINPIAAGTGQQGGGAALIDFDLDERPDLFITRKQPPNLLFRNAGGTFEPVEEIGDAAALDAAWAGVSVADIDVDGWPDLLLSGSAGNRLLLNDTGTGRFVEVPGTGLEFAGESTVGSALADLDRDGDLDVYVANHARCIEPFLTEPPTFDVWSSEECPSVLDVCNRNSLFIQEAPLQFVDRAAELGVDNDGCTLAVAASDFDGDGWVDLYSANDHGPQVEPDGLYWNKGTEGGALVPFDLDPNRLVLWNMGIAVGDPDRDGDLDYYFSNTQANKLWLQVAPRFFVESQEAAGVTGYANDPDIVKVSWGTAFEDFDLDGWQDLFVANTLRYDFVFWNRGDGTFAQEDLGPKPTERTPQFGAVFLDYDEDGDLDVLTSGMSREPEDLSPSMYLYENLQATGHHWLTVRLRATQGHPDAIGARIRVRSGGAEQMHEVSGGTSYGSARLYERRFGLGTATTADEVRVVWPSGRAEHLFDVPADQVLTMVEEEADVDPGDDDASDDDVSDDDDADDDAALGDDDPGGGNQQVGLDTPSTMTCGHGGSASGLLPLVLLLGRWRRR